MSIVMGEPLPSSLEFITQFFSSHEAQPCYCGEPNCVGFIGGKTQTDIAAMDDLFLDGMFLGQGALDKMGDLFMIFVALGISDEVELLGLKGSKKKKGRKLDEDYMVCTVFSPRLRWSSKPAIYSLHSSRLSNAMHLKSFKPSVKRRAARFSSNF